jgi:23S rRNA (guanosine2251-2'-O)-methyltransferase
MAGNSQRRGAMRKAGTKKGATVGSGGQKRQALEGRKPTPKAVDRPHHPAARRQRAVAKRADATTTKRATARSSGRRSAGSVLVGRNPVVEALRARIPASTLYVQTKVDADDRWREAMRLAVSMNISILEVTKTELDRMSDGAVHQGLVLAVPEYRYTEIDDLNADVIVALDGVTDPRNLGAIARSAAAFGAGGIVVPTRRSVGVTASAWKTSAGALARVPVAQVTNMTRTLESFQKKGYTVIGLAANGDVTLDAIDRDVLTSAVVIVVGAEGSGLSRLVGETCDWRVSIPMADGNESLNASVAASIVLQAVFSARS